MREILFKAKRKDNGEWVEGTVEFHLVDGDLTKTKIDAYITYDSMDSIGKVYRDRFEVIPETVGQYTTKNDIYDKKIFKDDIIEFEYYTTKHTGKVVFNDKTCGFEVWYNSIVGAYREKATLKVNFCMIENCKIIGNIHDNKELL